MFAGRYVWWMLAIIASFTFFTFYFDQVAWLLTSMLGCTTLSGTCGRVGGFLSGEAKLAVFVAILGILLICTVARIVYLHINRFWGFAFLVWCLDSAPFLLNVKAIVGGGQTLSLIAGGVPPSFLFLVVFAGFLAFPLEDFTVSPTDGWLRPLRQIAPIAAFYSVLVACATQPLLPLAIARSTRLFGLAALVEAGQPEAVHWLTLGTGSTFPVYAAWVIFVAVLAMRLWLRIPPAFTVGRPAAPVRRTFNM